MENIYRKTQNHMTLRERKLINMVLQHEGGYVMNKLDAGKETYCGISRRYNPSWRGWILVDRYKPLKHNQKVNDPQLIELVDAFYYTKYCEPLKLPRIENTLIAGHVLCHSVNAGISNGVKMLQKAINKVYGVNISVDGVIGNTTLSYMNNSRHNELATEYIRMRNDYYNSIVRKKPAQRVFLKGWLNRVKNTTQFCQNI